MEKVCIDILNKWAKYINYDAEQNQFVTSLNRGQARFELRNFEWETNSATKKIEHITNNYDESGILAVEVIKNTFRKITEESKLSVLDAIVHYDELHEHIEMYNALNSKEILDAEQSFLRKMDDVVTNMTGRKLLGESDNNIRIFEYIDTVIDALDNCSLELYKRGGKIQEIRNVSKSIHIFPSLAECVLTLDKAEDGMYLCYIDIFQSADSYFGLFIKSNGNMLSINDRVDEAYKGMHNNSRNGRWTEGKAAGIFPYNYIIAFDKADYKGYYHSYIIDEEKLSIFNLNEEAYIPILLAMILTLRKYNGKVINENLVYIDSLTPINIPSIITDKKELAIVSNNELVEMHKALNLDFDIGKILDGTAIEEFQKESMPYDEKICGNNKGQIFVDLYGADFKYEPNLLSTSKLLEGESGDEYIAEFIGSETRMRAQAFCEVRQQLADHIRRKMYEEYVAFGGIKKISEWFENSVKDNMYKLEQIIADTYYEVQKEMQAYNETHTDKKEFDKFFTNGGWMPSFCPKGYSISHETGRYVGYEYGKFIYANTYDRRNSKGFDMRTNAVCSEFYIIRPLNYIGLENLFGELPKIIKGWNKRGHHRTGNSLLSMTDAVEDIGTPFEYEEATFFEPYKSMNLMESTRMDFVIAIGYSKRGFKQMLKEHSRVD